MKRDTKRILIFGLFVVLIASFFISVVAAQSSTSLKTGFNDFFTAWTQGTMGVNMAKIMFFIMIALIVYMVLDGVFPQKTGITLSLGAVISFLSTAYLAPADIFSLLNSYTALGLTLSSMVPLLILGLLTYRASSQGNIQLSMLAHLSWWLFAAFSVYRFVIDWAVTKEGNPWMNGILLVVAIIALVMAVAYSSIRNRIARAFIREETDVAAQLVSEAWDLRAAEVAGARHAVNNRR